MICSEDPATLAPRARLREIGEILAVAYFRACVAQTARPVPDVAQATARQARHARQKALDEVTKNEPSCVPTPTARDSRDAATHGEHR